MAGSPADDYQRAKLLLGGGDPRQREEARVLLESALAAGHQAAGFRLAELLLEPGGDHPRALTLLRAAAGAGHARAAFRLGLLHARGEAGAAQDPGEAARWCRCAAERGLAAAQFNLGLLHAAGSGVDKDDAAAARWLRLAAVNGVSEAEGCLEVLYRDARERPRTWDEADTRASVALARTDPEAPKTMRFAEYYVDPCLDLLAQRMRLERDELEDIVQQFFCELEEPLERGALRGQAWKDALRQHYQAGRGAFRPSLGRTLVNFAREWLRRRSRDQEGGARPPAAPPESEAERHAELWRALLARFQAAVPAGRADAQRAAGVLLAVLADGTPHAELARRLGLSERTIRSDLRLGGELLADWLGAACAGLPADDPLAAALREGLALLPAWLHRIGVEKRTRALLFLALAERRLSG
jgi:TPR repeat protein